MQHLADQGEFTAAAQLKASAAEKRLLTKQAGYNTGTKMRVAKSAGGGWRLYVAVRGQWMDASLQDMQIKPGRPPLQPGQGKPARIELRTTGELADKAEKLADAAGVSRNTWIERLIQQAKK